MLKFVITRYSFLKLNITKRRQKDKLFSNTKNTYFDCNTNKWEEKYWRKKNLVEKWKKTFSVIKRLRFSCRSLKTGWNHLLTKLHTLAILKLVVFYLPNLLQNTQSLRNFRGVDHSKIFEPLPRNTHFLLKVR